jgi:hypothetical protein
LFGEIVFICIFIKLLLKDFETRECFATSRSKSLYNIAKASIAISVVDPDPAFQVNPDPDPDPVPNPGFDDQNWEKNRFKKKISFFSKIAIYLSLGLLKRRASNMRSF